LVDRPANRYLVCKWHKHIAFLLEMMLRSMALLELYEQRALAGRFDCCGANGHSVICRDYREIANESSYDDHEASKLEIAKSERNEASKRHPKKSRLQSRIPRE